MDGMIAAVLAAAGLTILAGTQPQLAARGSDVYLATGTGDTISVARSADGGTTFAAPVAISAGRLALGRHRGPRIAVTADAVIVAAIAGAKGGGADGDVRLYRSRDRGRTWLKPIVINDVPGAAREGLHALAANDAGVVAVAWLDLRSKGTRVYAATSRDHGANWSPDTLVYTSPSGSVCECCHPSLAIDTAGGIAVMFRNQVDGHRDMYVARSADGRTFPAAVKQGGGTWRLDACPMDGGGLAEDAGQLHAVWRREMTIFATAVPGPARSATPPANATANAEHAVGSGRDPAIAAAGGHVDVAWTGKDGVALRQDDKPVRTLGRGGFASLLARADRTIAAVEDAGRVTVHVVPR
jgi:hypothetical protein